MTDYLVEYARSARVFAMYPADAGLEYTALGIATEYMEYQLADSARDKVDELGDVLWYLTMHAYEVGLHSGLLKAPANCKSLHKEIVALLSLVKSHMRAGTLCRDVTEDGYCAAARVQLVKTMWAIRKEAEGLGISLEDCARGNISKLSKRHGLSRDEGPADPPDLSEGIG